MHTRTKIAIFVIVALVFIGLAVRATFFHAPLCESFECFEEHMRECKAANYLNEDPEATWRYEVIGVEGSACVVKVTLLQSKTGESGVSRLVGNSMGCGYPKGVVAYPEKDLGACHGRLREEMQNLIIERLHTYIVENLGEIDETLDLLVR